MPETITIAGFAIGFGIFLLGLFIGTNLGTLLMCLMRMASPEGDPGDEGVNCAEQH